MTPRPPISNRGARPNPQTSIESLEAVGEFVADASLAALPGAGDGVGRLSAASNGKAVGMPAAVSGVGVGGIWRGDAPIADRQATSKPSALKP